MKIQTIKAIYKDGAFKPVRKIKLPEGAKVTLVVEIETPPEPSLAALLQNPPPFSSFVGILGDVKEDSVTLKRKITKEYWPE